MERGEGKSVDASRELGEACARVMESPGKPLSGLAVVLLRGGRIAWEGYFGARRFAAGEGKERMERRWGEPDLPVDERTRWRVASISKPTATIGAMRLVEKGLLDLDRDISDYLGFGLRNPSFPDKKVTTRMLLGHTSSLRDAGFYYPPLGHRLEELFAPDGRYFDGGKHFAPKDPRVDKSPASFYCYCNLGYALLGSIVEKVAGIRFDLYMRETVFEPLGIDGGFNVNLLSDEGFANLSPIYRKCPADKESDDSWNAMGPWYPQIDDYRGLRPKLPVRIPPAIGAENQDVRNSSAPPSLEDYRLGENGSLFSPQGGMRIRARDLAKIAQCLIDGGKVDAGFGLEGGTEAAEPRSGGIRLLSEMSVDAMMTPGWRRREDGSNCEEEFSHTYATGIGLMRPTGPGGRPGLWGHRGNAYGFLGGMFVDRSGRSGYVYMIGGTGANPDTNRDAQSGLTVWEEALGRAIEKALRLI
ncbi:MAG TPA: serine hydrolase domain-containing protein [Rectinemataceae bacterium]|nr:serine hydrolase domain-containing protein [Rectinemataceae bacterium]